MKLREIVFLLKTDEFTIVYGKLVEFINGTEKESYKAMKKYFDLEVEKIIPLNNAVEIHLI